MTLQKKNIAARLNGVRYRKSDLKVADYTVDDNWDIVRVSGATVAVDVTLPDETMSIDQIIRIKVESVTNAVAVKASDGSTDVIASASAQTYLLHCDGTNWTVV